MAAADTGPGSALAAWRVKTRVLGLRQRTIVALLGTTEQWVSKELRKERPSPRLIAIIVAWQIMTPSQRGEWLFRAGKGALFFRQRLTTPCEDERADRGPVAWRKLSRALSDPP